MWLYFSGRIGDILVPRFHTITLLSGVGMIVLGLFVLFTLKEKSDCGHDHCEHDHDHHDQNPFVVLLLMIIPLSAALKADTSLGYSTDLLAQKGLFDNQTDNSAYQVPLYTKQMLEESTPKNQDGLYQLPLSQIFFSAGDDSMMDVFSEVKIETEGQVVPELAGEGNENRLRLYRILMTCCAADAMVIAFPIEFEKRPPVFQERSWVRVGGTLRYEEQADGFSPILHVEKIEAVPPPVQGGYTDS